MNWNELFVKFTQNREVTDLVDHKYVYLAIMMCIAGFVMLFAYLVRNIRKYRCDAKVTGKCVDVKCSIKHNDVYYTCDYLIGYDGARYLLHDVPYSGGAGFAGPAKIKIPEKGHSAKLRIRIKGDQITECWTHKDSVQQYVMLFCCLMFIGVARYLTVHYGLLGVLLCAD